MDPVAEEPGIAEDIAAQVISEEVKESEAPISQPFVAEENLVEESVPNEPLEVAVPEVDDLTASPPAIQEIGNPSEKEDLELPTAAPTLVIESAIPSRRGSNALVLPEEKRLTREETAKAARDALMLRYHAAVKERDNLNNQNSNLQRKLATFLRTKKPESDSKEQENKSVTNHETRYLQALSQVQDLKEELRKIENHYDRLQLEMKAKLEEKEAKAREIRDSFVSFKQEIARTAENSHTGKSIPMKVLAQFEAKELEKEAEVEKVRLKNIHVRNQMRKVEAQLRQKEELADGLHLIDFEQLKIENQTLNEKIEERNEELLKLRKKTTTTVQVLTHVKEKLQFVQGENAVIKKQLGELDAELTGVRDELNHTKHNRDKLRSHNHYLKQTAGLNGNIHLLLDFDGKKADLETKSEVLSTLKLKYEQLTRQVAFYAKRAAIGTT